MQQNEIHDPHAPTGPIEAISPAEYQIQQLSQALFQANADTDRWKAYAALLLFRLGERRDDQRVHVVSLDELQALSIEALEVEVVALPDDRLEFRLRQVPQPAA